MKEDAGRERLGMREEQSGRRCLCSLHAAPLGDGHRSTHVRSQFCVGKFSCFVRHRDQIVART